MCRYAGESKEPISIFEPIFKMEDQFEDPHLRIAERSWWPLIEGGSEEEEGWRGSSFF